MAEIYPKNIINLLEHYCLLLKKQQDVNYSIYDDTLHLELYQEEKKILSQFGLPEKIKYHHFLFTQVLLYHTKSQNINRLYQQLSLKAREFLSQKNTSEKQAFHRALINRQDPLEILPELQIPVNKYSLFVYSEIGLNQKIPNDKVWQELLLIKNKKLISEIYLLCFDQNYMNNSLLFQLLNEGLQYLIPFLEYYHKNVIS